MRCDLSASSPVRASRRIADYACHELEQNGDFDQANLRLIAYLTNFVETHRTHTPLLEEEHTNICAALESAFVQDGAAELSRLACAFTQYLLSCDLASHTEHHLRRAYETALFAEEKDALKIVLAALEQVSQQQDPQMSDILEQALSALSP